MGPSKGALAQPWWGRSLPKRNQWEWWDPGKGPLASLGEVGHSPRGTRGSAGTLDWVPMWLGSQSTCHPQCIPDTLHLWLSQFPQHPYEPQCPPFATYTPSGPWVPTLPANTQYTPDAPLMAQTPLGSPQCPLLPPVPILTPEYYTPCQPPNNPWHPLHPCAPNTHMGPQWPLLLPIPLLALEYLHSLPAPNTPLHPLTPLIAPHPLHIKEPTNAPWCHLYPFWPWNTYTPCHPPIHPWHPPHPNAPTALTPLGAPMTPYATYTPSGHWVPSLPVSPPNTPLTSLHPLTSPNTT